MHDFTRRALLQGSTALAAGAYLSFLLFLDWEKVVVEQPQIEILIQRLVCLFMVGNLANVLAEALRVQSEKHRRTAEHLRAGIAFTTSATFTRHDPRSR